MLRPEAFAACVSLPPGMKFMIWAVDQAVDSFRIKIWEIGGVQTDLYDNGFEQAIERGSITVQAN